MSRDLDKLFRSRTEPGTQPGPPCPTASQNSIARTGRGLTQPLEQKNLIVLRKHQHVSGGGKCALRSKTPASLEC